MRDHRVVMLEKLKNVTLYLGSSLSTEDIFEFSADDKFGFSHVFLATGATWRRDGIAREHREPIPGLEHVSVLTADDLMLGVSAHGKVVIFDDEHYYMGGVLAEKLRLDGHDVRLITPAPDISTWTHNTMEQGRIQKKLLELGVKLTPHHNLASVHPGAVELACVFTDRRVRHACDTLILVTDRLPNAELYRAMRADPAGIAKSGLKTIQCIGDCLAPGIIAAAVHSGHLFAREFEADAPGEVPFLRERVML